MWSFLVRIFLILLCNFRPNYALLRCSSIESCTELQHQRCMDTDGDEKPDTCLCEEGFFLKVNTCAPLPEGQVNDPCAAASNADLCKNGGTCRYNRDLRITECDCPVGFSGGTCEITAGQVNDPCTAASNANLCMNGGICQYNRDLRITECDCPVGFSGGTCEITAVRPTEPASPSLGPPCDPGHYLSEVTNECVPCDIGFYKAQQGTESCTACPMGEDGNRLITLNRTSTSAEQCIKGPAIIEFIPEYGPLAGGTKVNITMTYPAGFALTDITEFKIARAPCKVQRRQDMHSGVRGNLSCTTEAVPEVRSGPVSLKYKTLDLKSTDIYFYKEDPVIKEINHTKTIIVGGLVLTVYGEHLDSVYTPIFEVTREQYTDKRKFESVCTIESSTVMKCPIPNLVKGHGRPYVHPGLGSSGAQRNTGNGERPAGNFSQKPLKEKPAGGGRRKRGLLDEPAYNNKWTHYWMGFRLDGVDRYRNVTDMFGEMLVYPVPVLERLHNDQHSVYYFDHAKTNGNLQIKGQRLTYAATKDDYVVQVGVGYCNVTNLYINAIDCLMPHELPAPGPVSGPENSPQVIVIVGNYIFAAGFITYSKGPSGPAIIGIVIGAIVVCILIFTLIACFIIRMRHNKRNNAKNVNLETLHSQNPPNIYQDQSGRYSSSHSNGYLQPVNQRTPSRGSLSSGNSLTPLMIPMPGAQGEPRSNRSMSHGSINMFPDSPGTPSTPTTPNITQNVAYQVPRHNSIPFDIMDEISQDLKLIINECRVDSSRLSLKDSIGKGFFGKVYRGTLKDQSGKEELTVAIKTVQGKECTVRDVEAFLAEAIVMKDFDHPNVINLLGVVIAGNRPFAILPYMEFGDLKSYISEPDRSIKVRELLGFGVQVAAGMEYLASQKIVHRDLATRNCMVNKSLVVRIADFGLSRDIYKSDYYRVEDKHRPLPVKWMAIESLTGGVFTSSSDVWSFGVLLWELLTRGCSPYPDIDTFNLKTYLLAGRRLPQPEHAPDNVYSLMCSCWEELPENRHTFEELHKSLAKIVEEEEENMTPEYLKLI